MATIKYLLLVCISIQSVLSANQMVVYWGQNSAGSFTNVPSEQEKPLRNYCQDSSYDIIVVGFVYLFPSARGNTDPTLPGMNFANHCEVPFDQSNPFVLNCTQNIAPDIAFCQSRGKKIFLSFGGGVGSYGFTSDAQAITFATTVWNMFLGGNGAIRPFGSAIFDGIDLDIEGGTQVGYIKFIAQLRAYFASQTSRAYYISSAPQCFYPDRLGPGSGTPLTEAWFDYIWIQFYNNHCGLDEYPQNFNFARWVTGMANSANPNVKLFIGAPASPQAAASGFVNLNTLQTIATAIGNAYPNIYGGIMIWDTATSDLYNNFAVQVASFVHSQSVISAPTAPVVVSTPPSTPVVPSSSTGRLMTPSSTTSAVHLSLTTTSVIVTPTPPTVIPVTPSPPVSSSCSVDGYMKCLSASTYSTCNHGQWGVTQSCGINTQCSPIGNYIYCVSTDTPISIPSSPTPVPQTISTTNAASPVVAPTSLTTSPKSTPPVSSAPSGSAAGTACPSLGYQQCVGTNSYQTCANGRNGFVWAASQMCQKGLSCHSSATANNIYCY